jgi:hypothetical protein
MKHVAWMQVPVQQDAGAGDGGQLARQRVATLECSDRNDTGDRSVASVALPPVRR